MSDNFHYRQLFSPSIKTTPTNLDGSLFCRQRLADSLTELDTCCGQLGVAIFGLSLLE